MARGSAQQGTLSSPRKVCTGSLLSTNKLTPPPPPPTPPLLLYHTHSVGAVDSFIATRIRHARRRRDADRHGQSLHSNHQSCEHATHAPTTHALHPGTLSEMSGAERSGAALIRNRNSSIFVMPQSSLHRLSTTFSKEYRPRLPCMPPFQSAHCLPPSTQQQPAHNMCRRQSLWHT